MELTVPPGPLSLWGGVMREATTEAEEEAVEDEERALLEGGRFEEAEVLLVVMVE